MGRWWRGVAAMVAALALGGAGLAQDAADGFPLDEPLWPADAAATPLGIAMRPAGWQAGDAMVVLAPSTAWPPGLRDRLAQALSGAGAAVVDLNPPFARLQAVVAALRGDAGVLVVLGPEGVAPVAEGVTVSIALDMARPLVRPGAPPPSSEAWPVRGRMLCDLLAATLRLEAPEAWVAHCAAGVVALRGAE